MNQPDFTISVDLQVSKVPAQAENVKKELRSVAAEADRTAKAVSKSLASPSTRTDYGLRRSRPSMANDEEERLRRLAAFMQREMPSAASAASNAIGGVEEAAAGAGKGLGGMSLAAGGVVPVLGAVLIAVTAVIAIMAQAAHAAISLGKEIYGLAKAFADYGSQLARSQIETGLSLRTLSALQHQAAVTGTEFGDLTKGMGEFRTRIGEAAAGSEEARKYLKLIGIEGKGVQDAMSNVDGAFRTAVASIVAAKDPLEQNRKAFAAFGDEGYKLIPFLQSFHGNVDEAVEAARKYGLMLSDEDARAAKAFQKSQAEMEASINSLKITFGREFLDTVKQTVDEVNRWFQNNQDAIHRWATNSGLMIRGIKSDLVDLAAWVNAPGGGADILRWYSAIATFGYSELGRSIAGDLTQRWKQNGGLARGVDALSPDNTIFLGPQQVQASLGAQVDPAALNAYRAYKDKPQKAARVPRGRVAGLSDEQKQINDLNGIIADLNRQIEFYGDKSQVAAIKQQLLNLGIKDFNSELAKEALRLAAEIDLKDKSAAADAGLAKSRKEAAEAFAKAKSGIDNNQIDERIRLGTQTAILTQEVILNRDLSEIERQRIENERSLIQAQMEYARQGFNEEQVKELVDRLGSEKDVTMAIAEQNQKLTERRRIQELNKTLTSDMAEELADLNRQIAENNGLTAQSRVEQLQLSEAYRQLTPEMQKARLEQAKQIDDARNVIKGQEEVKRALEIARQKYENFYQTIRDSLGVLRDQGFGEFFKHVTRMFQDFLLDMVAKWIASKFFKMFFQGGNTQAANQNGQGGGILGGIFQAIFGGGTGSLTPGGGINTGSIFGGNAGGGIFNFGGGGGSGPSGIPPTGSIVTLPDGTQAYQVNGSGIGGGGGLFSPPTNPFTGKVQSGFSGVLSGIGAIASVVGGAIGGRVGNVISYAGTGLSIGAMFGPWGAAIGAGIGALVGLFMGDPKKKKDKNENMPKLQQGFMEAIQQLNQLKSDRAAIYSNPDGAIAKAQELRTQIAAGFGIQFLSKKYQKEAQALIAQKVREADDLIKEITDLAGTYRYAKQIDDRLVTSFAGGVFMSPAFVSQFRDFKRRNGFLGGRFTGSDTLPSMLAPGEMVLNPYQIAAVKSNAGMDPFQRAGIPGYASGAAVTASSPMTAASLAPSIVVQPVIQISIEGEGISDARIMDVLVDGVKDPDVQAELVRAYDKAKTRKPQRY